MRLAKSTSKMLFDTTMPIIMSVPIIDSTFTEVFVKCSIRTVPIHPSGTATRMISGSINDRNNADHHQIDQQHGQRQGQSEVLKAPRMLATSPLMLTVTSLGSVTAARTCSMSLATRPEIVSDRCHQHIDQTRQVVVVHRIRSGFEFRARPCRAAAPAARADRRRKHRSRSTRSILRPAKGVFCSAKVEPHAAGGGSAGGRQPTACARR